jgi:hypothetical protein
METAAPATMEEVASRLTDALLKVASNKGAPGPDGQTIEALADQWPVVLRVLQADLLAGTYRPGGIRRVVIPKAGGGQRGLGIPDVVDRVVQEAVRQVLEPLWEPTFHPSNHGFRPGRSCHTAIAEAMTHLEDGCEWVVDLDLEKFLEPSSHCLCVHEGWVEEAGFGRWDQYSQAFSASVADVDGLQFAALDTLQHCLAAELEGSHRVDDWDVAGGGVFDEQGAKLVIDADPPWGAGGVLVAGDESGLQPAVKRGCGDAELLGGFGDGEQLAVERLVGRLVGGDVAVAAQPADDDLGEGLAGGGAAALTVEDPGDRGVVVVGGKPCEQLDRVLVGTDGRLVAWQRDGELGDRGAFPADRDGRAVLLALDV